MAHRIVLTKESKTTIAMLGTSARKTLGLATSDKLPPLLKAYIGATEIPAMLQEIVNACELATSRKLTAKPKRDAAVLARRLALVRAAEMLPPGKPLKDWYALAADIYGTRNAASMRSTSRGLIKWLKGVKAATEAREAEAKAEVAALKVRLASLRGGDATEAEIRVTSGISEVVAPIAK